MIKAVFWDFGGVLTASPLVNFHRYERENGLPHGFLSKVNMVNHDHNAWARFERDQIDLATFDREFETESAALGHPVPGRDVAALLNLELRPAMVAALETVGRHFKTACITNNLRGPASSGADDSRPAVKRVFDMFDVVIESSKVGLRKPDPEIFHLACDRVGVEPGEVVFLDDLGVNLKPARAMGMTTIKVEDPARALQELAQVTGLDLES